MSLGEGRAWLLAEGPHDPIVAVVAEQHHTIEREQRRTAFGLEGRGDFAAPVGRKVGEGPAAQGRELLQGRAGIVGVALEALQDVGEDQLVVGARDIVGRAGRDHLGRERAQVAGFGGGEGRGVRAHGVLCSGSWISGRVTRTASRCRAAA